VKKRLLKLNEIELPPNPYEDSTNLMAARGENGKDVLINRMKFFTSFCIDNDIRTVLELGTDTGFGSTYFILKSGTELWTVDVDPSQYLALILDSVKTYHRIIADDTKPIPEIDGKTFDMVFLDTSHEFEHTKFEIQKYYPMALKWFLVDDYHWGDGNDRGVFGACQESGLPFKYIDGNDIWGVKK
jgi:hypothetical protein